MKKLALIILTSVFSTLSMSAQNWEIEEIVQNLIYNNQLREYFSPEIKAVIVCPYACGNSEGAEHVETELGIVHVFYSEEWKGPAFQLGITGEEAILIHDINRKKDLVELRLQLTHKKDHIRIVLERSL